MVNNKDFKLRTLLQKTDSPTNKDFRLRTGTQKDAAPPVGGVQFINMNSGDDFA
jgi:hypothetical protein